MAFYNEINPQDDEIKKKLEDNEAYANDNDLIATGYRLDGNLENVPTYDNDPLYIDINLYDQYVAVVNSLHSLDTILKEKNKDVVNDIALSHVLAGGLPDVYVIKNGIKEAINLLKVYGQGQQAPKTAIGIESDTDLNRNKKALDEAGSDSEKLKVLKSHIAFEKMLNFEKERKKYSATYDVSYYDKELGHLAVQQYPVEFQINDEYEEIEAKTTEIEDKHHTQFEKSEPEVSLLDSNDHVDATLHRETKKWNKPELKLAASIPEQLYTAINEYHDDKAIGEGAEHLNKLKQLNQLSESLLKKLQVITRIYYDASESKSETRSFSGIGRTKPYENNNGPTERAAKGEIKTIPDNKIVLPKPEYKKELKNTLSFHSKYKDGYLKNEIIHKKAWNKEPRGKGQAAAMGGYSANSYYAHFYPDNKSGRFEWLHLIGSSLGGPTVPNNLVAGSYDTNTRMIPLEANIALKMKGLLNKEKTPEITINSEAKLKEGDVNGAETPVNIAESIKLSAKAKNEDDEYVTLDRAYDTLNQKHYTPAEYRAEEYIFSYHMKKFKEDMGSDDITANVNKMLNFMQDNRDKQLSKDQIQAEFENSSSVRPTDDKEVFKLTTADLRQIGFAPIG